MSIYDTRDGIYRHFQRPVFFGFHDSLTPKGESINPGGLAYSHHSQRNLSSDISRRCVVCWLRRVKSSFS
jgi:hypothetical protein